VVICHLIQVVGFFVQGLMATGFLHECKGLVRVMLGPVSGMKSFSP
jgi:hypothetical protein